MFKNKLRSQCINIDDNDGRYWCYTKVDENFKPILGGDKIWGYCSEFCPPLNQDNIPETTTTATTTSTSTTTSMTTTPKSECRTTNDGPDKDAPCVIPFAFKG